MARAMIAIRERAGANGVDLSDGSGALGSGGAAAARLRDFSHTGFGRTHATGCGADGHAFQAPAVRCARLPFAFGFGASCIVDILFKGAVRSVCISVPVAKTVP